MANFGLNGWPRGRINAPLSALRSGTALGGAPNGPGSNGFLRREMYRVPGTYTWTAPRSGMVMIQALGACPGGSATFPGPSSPFGEKRLFVAAGQSLTIVIGTGGAGSQTGASTAGGSTSISGPPVGGTALTIPGGTPPNVGSSSVGAAAVATGPWDLVTLGATSASGKGCASSGSPWGNGFGNGADDGIGGAGWGGPSRSNGGASSHRPLLGGGNGAWGLLARGGRAGTTAAPTPADAEALPFWDMRSVDSGGGQVGNATDGRPAGSAGPGAGGAGTNDANAPGTSMFGGGTGYGGPSAPSGLVIKSGNGTGGCGVPSGGAGAGGDGLVFLFWQEVV